MINMRLGLLVLGAVFIFAVWLFNKFQERKVRQRIEAPFARARSDVLLDTEGRPAQPEGGRAEPTFGELPSDYAQGHAGEVTSEDVAAGRSRNVSNEPIVPDDLIHVIVPLALEQAVSGERALAALSQLRRAGRQSVIYLGRSDEHWYALVPGARYDALLALVQLANRHGPLNEVEYSEFIAALQYAAEQIPASCHAPDMMETIARARQLDARCAALDRQIGINLANPEGLWGGNRIAEVAQAANLVLRSDGRFHFLASDGSSLFTLQSSDGSALRTDQLAGWSTARLTLLLDVPRAAQHFEPYAQMISMAQDLSESLSAILVDDELKTLTPATLAAIGKQIEPVYAELEAVGTPAGSARALSLFN